MNFIARENGIAQGENAWRNRVFCQLLGIIEVAIFEQSMRQAGNRRFRHAGTTRDLHVSQIRFVLAKRTQDIEAACQRHVDAWVPSPGAPAFSFGRSGFDGRRFAHKPSPPLRASRAPNGADPSWDWVVRRDIGRTAAGRCFTDMRSFAAAPAITGSAKSLQMDSCEPLSRLTFSHSGAFKSALQPLTAPRRDSRNRDGK